MFELSFVGRTTKWLLRWRRVVVTDAVGNDHCIVVIGREWGEENGDG